VHGTRGSSSVFGSMYTSIGGGGGALSVNDNRASGTSGAYGGGSGCGAKNDNTVGTVNAVCGLADVNICGGTAQWTQYVGSSGGGGGCGGSGGNASSSLGGTGGLGRYVSEFSVDVCGGGSGNTRHCSAFSNATHGGGIGGKLDSGYNPHGVPNTGGGGAGAAEICNDRQGNGGSGLVMIRYRILSPSWIRNTQQPLFAMGIGPHALTVGMSAGSARISHLKFLKGGNSCHFYKCASCPSGVKTVSPHYGADTCTSCVFPSQQFNVVEQVCACTTRELFDDGTNTCKCGGGYEKL
jgi:hypothetical protein